MQPGGGEERSAGGPVRLHGRPEKGALGRQVRGYSAEQSNGADRLLGFDETPIHRLDSAGLEQRVNIRRTDTRSARDFPRGEDFDNG